MSKKDYVKFAEIISKSSLTLEQKERLANEFAKVFADDNERFNREKFLEACMVD